MKRIPALLLLLPLAACGDSGRASVDFDGDESVDDLFVVHSQDGGVKMALTEEHVYFALGDSARAAAQVEMAEDTGGGRVDRVVGGIVRGTVSRALSFRARYMVDEIRDIRWQDGEMVIEFVDPDRTLDARFRVDDRPVSDAFTERDVRAFAEAFRELKQSQDP